MIPSNTHPKQEKIEDLDQETNDQK